MTRFYLLCRTHAAEQHAKTPLWWMREAMPWFGARCERCGSVLVYLLREATPEEARRPW